jgi:hypothetical protein
MDTMKARRDPKALTQLNARTDRNVAKQLRAIAVLKGVPLGVLIEQLARPTLEHARLEIVDVQHASVANAQMEAAP